MTDTDDMVYIAQGKFEELVCQNACGICKSKEGMIGKDSTQTHGPCVQNGFMTKATKTPMTMHNLNLLANHNVSKDGEKGKYGWKGGFAVYDEEGNVINFEPVGQVPDTSSVLVCVSDDNDFMPTVDELGGQLVDVGLDSARLGKEEVANHGNIIRHG